VYGRYGGFSAPGQREVIRADEQRDISTVLKQWGVLVVFWTMVVLLAWANVLIIGPGLGVAAVGVALVYAWLYLLLRVRREMCGDTFTTTAVVVFCVGVTIIGLWAWYGPGLIESVWWPVRCEWAARNKLVFVVFSAGFIYWSDLVLYRFGYEVPDPRWPPLVEMRPAWWGPLRRGTSIPAGDNGDEPEPRPAAVRQVPRPVAVTGALAQSVTDDLDPVRVERNLSKTVIAPSGREVRVSDLVTFARLSGRIGTAWATWKGRRRDDGSEWDNDAWSDVLDVWALYGVVTPREQRKTTRVLVTDFTEAMRRLSGAFD
jgi:hypothetical protein